MRTCTQVGTGYLMNSCYLALTTVLFTHRAYLTNYRTKLTYNQKILYFHKTNLHLKFTQCYLMQINSLDKLE